MTVYFKALCKISEAQGTIVQSFVETGTFVTVSKFLIESAAIQSCCFKQ